VFLNTQLAGSWKDGIDGGNAAFTFDVSRTTDGSSSVFFYERLTPEFDVNQTGFLRKEPFRGRERAKMEFVVSPRPDVGGLKQAFLGGWVDGEKPILTDRYLEDQLSRYDGTVFGQDFLDEKRGFGGGGYISLELDTGASVELFASKQRRYDITGAHSSDSLGVRVRTPSQNRFSFQGSAFVDDFFNFGQRHVSREWALTLDSTILLQSNWRVESRVRHSRTFDPNDMLEDRIWLGSLRTIYMFTPDTYLNLFFQGRSDETPFGTKNTFLISNVFRWEFRRGSRLFVAFNDARDDGTGTYRLRESDARGEARKGDRSVGRAMGTARPGAQPKL